MSQSTKTDTTAEKRRAPRIEAINTVEYVLYDAKKTKTGHGRAFTVNLSQTGTLVQTKNKIDGALELPEVLLPDIFLGIQETYWDMLKSVPDPRSTGRRVYPLHLILHRIISGFY